MTAITMTSTITVEPIRVLAEDRFVAEAARVSTKGGREQRVTDPGHVGLIRALVRDKHGSPFEHNLFTFRVHAPLYVFTEHLRHRAGWSYNGESGRYKTFEPVFYTPPAERGVTQVGRAIEYDVQRGTTAQRREVEIVLRSNSNASWNRYERLLEAGVAREVARQVLPTNLMTTYYTTCNARSLMAFLSLRTSDAGTSHPLWEIEQVAKGYEAALAAAMPATHAAFNEFGRTAP
jgi:thymidylate synthase (FAD)